MKNTGYIKNSKLLDAALTVYKRQPKTFNGKNFALEVNQLLGIDYEPDTAKRYLRKLRGLNEVNYEFIKSSKCDGFFGLYVKKDFKSSLQLCLF